MAATWRRLSSIGSAAAPDGPATIPNSTPTNRRVARTDLEDPRWWRVAFMTLLGYLGTSDARRRPLWALQGLGNAVWAYSHSMVPGGFEVTSYTTRLMPGTSLMMRFDIFSKRSYGRRAQSAVIASSLVTARIMMGRP